MSQSRSENQSTPPAGKLGQHAVVIGGSIAGCLTARVLSDYFSKVTIYDADTPPEDYVPRKGVPQGNHIHTLIPGGAMVIRKYFPDIHDELVAAGADYGDPMLKWRLFMGGGWVPRVASGMRSYMMSRPLLEAMVRKHTLALANIELHVATPVQGVNFNPDNSSVTGVTLESGEVVQADFVADVSGRNSQASKWLKEMGFAPPERSSIGIDVGYTTFVVAEPPGSQRDWNMLYTIQKDIPADTRGGGIFCIEGGRYLVSAQGYHKDYAPVDWQGFLDFFKSHPFPAIYETIKDCQPIGEAKEYRYAAYLRRHYERLSEFPKGFVVLGDAICSLNPVYGQGMTVAAKEVEHLDQCLSQCAETGQLPADFALGFFKGAAKFIDAAWNGVTVEDFRYPQTRGERPKGYGLAKWLNSKFFALSKINEEFSIAFAKVQFLVEPPESILKPKFLLKALFAKMPEYDEEPTYIPPQEQMKPAQAPV